MGRFFGNKFGANPASVNPGDAAESGIYSISDHYYVKQEGGFVEPVSATGGSTYTPGDGYKYHKFTYPNSDSFVKTAGDVNVDILVVAGGGGGGSYYGAGAGAGGVAIGLDISLPNATHQITVGNGGVGGAGSNPPAKNGGNSAFGTSGNPYAGQPDHIIAKGGGGGGNTYTAANGQAGGSGGGDAGGNSPPYGGLATQPGTNPSPKVTDHGYPGGYSYPTGGYAPAGGGGAGAQGVNLTQNQPGGGNGGDGVPISQFPYPKIGEPGLNPYSPTNNHYGGGGGASIYHTAGGPAFQGKGGDGGGGSPPTGQSAIDKLGGGGGGGHPSGGGSGGQGIVVVRYQWSAP